MPAPKVVKISVHQSKQQEIVNRLASQVSNHSPNFSTVAPVKDYVNDARICLTSIHLPHRPLLEKVQKEIITPLRDIEPNLYYYPNDGLHMTIKNIRVINQPAHFNEKDVKKAIRIFDDVIPKHKKFNVYFYRLLLFQNNLALIGTTDEELDNIILKLDQRLRENGIPDDKMYANEKYFFSNMTIARFNDPVSEAFKGKVDELSQSLKFQPYQVDSVTLITSNAVLQSKNIRGTWELK